MSDLEGIDEIDLDATYKARALIDLIRARTFHPYPGAYFRDHGKKVFLRLELAYEEGAASG
jgi:methionyl-tRNA formyltransferase